MKKIPILVFAVCLQIFFQTSRLYAQTSWKWDMADALSKNDLPKVEKIISDNVKNATSSEKGLMYAFILDYSWKDSTPGLLQMLRRYSVYPTQYDLFNAINRSHSDTVVQYILDQGVKPNGEILLFAAEKKRFNLVNAFIRMGADVNYRYPQGKDYADGTTALIHAAAAGNLETVKLLVENGAKVNLQTTAGYTAALVAQEANRTEIYDYLMQHGATASIPYQISGGPAQGNAANNPAAAQPSASSQGMSSVMDGTVLAPKSGTYRLTGSTTEIKLNGNNEAGMLQYTRQGKPMTGWYTVTNGTLTISMEGKSFVYKIESEAIFSGNGERWTRTGN